MASNLDVKRQDLETMSYVVLFCLCRDSPVDKVPDVTRKRLTNAFYIRRISRQRSKPQTRRASLRMGIASSKILEF